MPKLSSVRRGSGQVARLYRGSSLLWEHFSFPTEPHMANQFLWVDPSELQQAYNTGIASLSDKTANGYDFSQITTGRQPIFAANAINGMPAMQFDGIDDSLSTVSGPNPGDEYTISVVVKPTSLRHSSDTASYGNTIFAPSSQYAAWVSLYAYTLDGPGQVRHWPYTSSVNGDTISQGDTIEVDEAAVITVEAVRGGSARAYINGVEVGSYSASTTAVNGYLTIGDLRTNRNICWHGYIGELVMYDKVLNPIERSQTEQYLAGKWMQEAVAPVYVNSLLTAVADCADIANFGGTIGDKLLLTFEDAVELTGTVDDLAAEFGTELWVPAIADSVDGYVQNGNTVVLEAVGTFSSYRNFTNEVVNNVLGVAYALVQDVPITQPTIFATGGTVYDDGGYRYHEFTTSGDFIVSAINGTGDIEYLVVAGGGGGAGVNNARSGGGGAGGLLSGSVTVAAGTIAVVVGGGGDGGAGSGVSEGSVTDGGDGTGSSFGDIDSTGGGGGGRAIPSTATFGSGRAGGSGGGAGRGFDGGGGSGTTGQGNDGGASFAFASSSNYGSGGGGASAAGGNHTSGNGGDGTAVWGTTYAGGGGGGGDSTQGVGGDGGGGRGSTAAGVAPTAGSANTGGGGGGARAGLDGLSGAAGGSGIVIVRYPL